MENYTMVAGITLLLTLSLANVVSADSGFRAYNYYAGGGFLCTLSPSFCPDVAMATNGDTVTGSGTFVHQDSAGNVIASGTWTATQLVSFVSYGSAGSSFPPGFEGGK